MYSSAPEQEARSTIHLFKLYYNFLCSHLCLLSALVFACSIREKHNTKWTACLLPNLLEHTVIGLNTNHVISFLKHKCYNIARCRYDGGRVEIPAEISQTLRIWHERTDRQFHIPLTCEVTGRVFAFWRKTPLSCCKPVWFSVLVKHEKKC